jgi:hypothetical protein
MASIRWATREGAAIEGRREMGSSKRGEHNPWQMRPKTADAGRAELGTGPAACGRGGAVGKRERVRGVGEGTRQRTVGRRGGRCTRRRFWKVEAGWSGRSCCGRRSTRDTRGSGERGTGTEAKGRRVTSSAGQPAGRSSCGLKTVRVMCAPG